MYNILCEKEHSVLRILIRCYFSPEYSTGQRYIYTGSHDSCVYVYDLVSGAIVARLAHRKSTVRDCSWHPHYPMLVSSSFDGEIAKWEFPGYGETRIPVNTTRPRRQHFD
ncbi:LEC14B protein-like [Rutidosis leptorrhynchoides]|uniref:LEC14B protein-like n=1 Tax=Rutidosis leptorrhynchoides TaxID=125765 RepID=UPI003A9A5AC7